MRFPRPTLRARLTLVYGGLFLLAGVVLLGLTYALVSRDQPGDKVVTQEGPPPPVGSGPQLHGRLVKVAESTWQDALNALLTQGAIALLLVGGVAVVIGWLIAGQLLHPLHQITETARRIADAPAADRSLHERIGLDGPYDEVKRLADTFDLMLERLDQSFDGQRRFIANASHELRTPLTLNRALLEVALYPAPDAPDSPEVRHLARTLLEINARHERLIDGLLTLARAEPQLSVRAYVDLADVVEHVTSQQPMPVETSAEPAPTTGDPVLLERLVQNLVDNAVRHNLADGGWVRVATGPGEDGSVRLTVSNTGPVVPPYEVPALFEPFRRLAGDRLATATRPADSAASPGRPGPPSTGLGLSIVRAVAHAHGGEVAGVPREGGGLVVTVTLPAAPPISDLGI